MAGLREQAEADLGFILEGDPAGFRWPVTLITPAGVTHSGLFGFSDDIALLIDPDTGQAVSGRKASATLRISTLRDLSLTELPRGIEDRASAPWRIQFDDINGLPYDFRVLATFPDRALGCLVCMLELYTP